MDCFNFGCPFRVNETSSCNYCGCLACPNRDSREYTIISNRTLTDKEIVETKAQLDSDYGGREVCMSILIKDMEMPPNCCQCPVNMEVCKRGYEYLLEHPELYDKRADDCPLVPVPPHGRLIDADALCERLEKAKEIKPYLVGGLYTAISFALIAPTIIPAEDGE